MITQGLIAAVGTILREMPRNPHALNLGQELKVALEEQSNRALDKANKAPFDKKAYQRDYMRKRRQQDHAKIKVA